MSQASNEPVTPCLRSVRSGQLQGPDVLPQSVFSAVPILCHPQPGTQGMPARPRNSRFGRCERAKHLVLLRGKWRRVPDPLPYF